MQATRDVSNTWPPIVVGVALAVLSCSPSLEAPSRKTGRRRRLPAPLPSSLMPVLYRRDDPAVDDIQSASSSPGSSSLPNPSSSDNAGRPRASTSATQPPGAIFSVVATEGWHPLIVCRLLPKSADEDERAGVVVGRMAAENFQRGESDECARLHAPPWTVP